VEALYALYMDGVLRAGLLDARREPMLPARDDLRDLLTRKEIADGSFYTIESETGDIVGFCSLRGINIEARFGEYGLQLSDARSYTTAVATEAHDFLMDRAFARLGLRKVLAHALSTETEFVEFLRSRGFSSAGIQRDVLHARGGWHHLETLVMGNPALMAS
jgi:RimJ/RimL family protein N-acetyltransferase